MSTIADRLAGVRSRIADAATSAGRDPSSSGSSPSPRPFPSPTIRQACLRVSASSGKTASRKPYRKSLGMTDLSIRWHFLGHLQPNKARKAAPAFAAIHGLDSLELLKKIDRRGAANAGRTPDLFIQVDLAGEATRYGLRPDEVPRTVRDRDRVPRRQSDRTDDAATDTRLARGRAALV